MFRLQNLGFFKSPLTFIISITIIHYEVPHPQRLFSLSIEPSRDIGLFSNIVFPWHSTLSSKSEGARLLSGLVGSGPRLGFGRASQVVGMFWRLGDMGSGAATGDKVTCFFVNAWLGGLCGVDSANGAVRGFGGLGFAKVGKSRSGVAWCDFIWTFDYFGMSWHWFHSIQDTFKNRIKF